MTRQSYKFGLLDLLKTVLPLKVRNSLLHVAFNVAHDEFLKFAHQYAFAPNMDLGLREIAARGFRPKSVVDVGAFEGHWTAMAHEIWPAARFTMIEANESKKETLDECAGRIGGRVHYALLGAQDGKEVEFAVMESGSSVFEERRTEVGRQTPANAAGHSARGSGRCRPLEDRCAGL